MKRAFPLVLVLISLGIMASFTVLAVPEDAATESPVDKIDLWLTTGTQLYKLEHQTGYFSRGTGNSPTKIQVSEAIKYQEMDGFGAALTDSAAWLIYHLPEITRTRIMSDLFSSKEGIGISYLRLPMGASDFVTGTQHYTYDDMPPGMTDTQLVSFSVRHDLDYIIPVISDALRINPHLKVMATPWSAPAWMKSPESLYGGCLNRAYCQVYANYFVSFTQAYEDERISIRAVTVQNEPYNPPTCEMTTTYPTMHMEPSDQAYFVKNCLGPAFDENGIDTEILVWDHNWDGWAYPLDVLSDPAARGYITGSAWHCYAGDPASQSLVHDPYPDKGIYLTECTGKLGSDFADDLDWNFHNLFIGAVRHWAKTVLLWNLALDPNGAPQLGSNCSGNGNPGCRGVITIHDNGQVDKNVEYYALGHLGKVVDPGAMRIESSSSGDVESVAFQNPDQSVVLVVLNHGTAPQAFDVQWHGRFFTAELEPKSVMTLKWKIYEAYLPVIWKQYRPPFFQDFEPDNGTLGSYFRYVWEMTCMLDPTFAHEGRSLKCRAHGGEVGAHGGTVAIYPSSHGQPVDVSSGETFSLWVYDEQGSNDLELKLCDEMGCHDNNKVWSDNKSVQGAWTEITWQLAKFTEPDKSNITHVEIYEWNDGNYHFDSVSWNR